MRFSKNTLKNGLRVITVSLPNLESATVTVWVKTGSRMEENRVAGISHFLEHMVFKGSKKRPTAKEIAEEVDAIGGEFNAATNKDWTNFYIKARAGNLSTAFDVLADMVLNPILAEEEIEREKGVIVEEIRMYQDLPQRHVQDVFMELLYGDQPAGWNVAGTEDNVRSFGRSHFIGYRKDNYVSSATTIVVAGSFGEKETIEKIKADLRDELTTGKV